MMISLVKSWKADKYAELQSVQVAVRTFPGCSVTISRLFILRFSFLHNLFSCCFSHTALIWIQASFCTGATFATISWTKQPDPLWVTDALWFFSLICSIWAVITSIQTKSLLDDLPDPDQLNKSLPDIEVKRMRRMILRYKKTPGLKHYVMMFVWQFPSMTMSYAWCTFLSGLTVYVCTPFIRHMEWENRHKVMCYMLSIVELAD
jgi:hypothetical protein